MALRFLKKIALIAAIITFTLPTAYGKDVQPVRICSPDNKNVLELDCPGNDGNMPLTFTVTRNNRTIIEPSALRITLAGNGELTEGAQLLEAKQGRINERFHLLWGKSSIVKNNCNSASLRFENKDGLLWNLELRAYDDGVAFRYCLLKQPMLNDFVLKSETTEYRLAGNPTMLFMTLPSFTTSHENVYQRKPLNEVPVNSLIDMPVMAVWPDGTSAALTEAGLRDFAGMYLKRDCNEQPTVLQCRLSPLPSKNMCVIGQTPHFSPWRVIFLADKAGQILESNLLLCLNDPPKGDYSWLKPGKTTWHWWNGMGDVNLPFHYGMNYKTHKYYIDFCERNGIAYHAIVADDKPWYFQTSAYLEPGPDTDILRPRPELKLPQLLDYAKKHNVSIRLWVHWKPLNERLEETFSQYEKWGVSGLMVDFLDRQDQQMVQFCERVLESAARHKLHIQFHGSYKPSGEQRTFPNLFNREGVLNLEYLKWSSLCTPQHNVDVAYTRALAGPVDYHLGGFHSVPPGEFKPRNDNPNVLGSRCHHLALYVVYENPMPMVCDKPSAYEGQPGVEFLKEVPTTWDETRFVAGEPGEYIVIARRKNTTWYLGGINNETARKIRFPLAFLGNGEYEANLFMDDSLSGKNPNALRREQQSVTDAASLEITMSPGGGFTAVIKQNKNSAEVKK